MKFIYELNLGETIVHPAIHCKDIHGFPWSMKWIVMSFSNKYAPHIGVGFAERLDSLWFKSGTGKYTSSVDDFIAQIPGMLWEHNPTYLHISDAEIERLTKIVKKAIERVRVQVEFLELVQSIDDDKLEGLLFTIKNSG